MKMMIEIDPTFKDFIKRLQGFERTFMGNLNVASKQAGKLIKDTIPNVMADTAWSPNEKEYRDWKISHGFDSEPLFRTHLLANSISFQRTAFGPQMIRGEVGWYRGMRYPGILQERMYSGRVPHRRKSGFPKLTKRQREFTRMQLPPPKSLFDVKYLGDVALWNEYGSKGRPGRAFVKATLETIAKPVTELFRTALDKSLPVSGMEEAPF